MRNAFVQRLADLAGTNPRIFLITGDLGYGVLTDFAKSFPRQFLNAGVAEQNMTGIAAGLALDGRIVFTYSIGNFCTLRCLEQIRNDAAYHGADVKIVSIGGGFSYGALGMSHHATEDIAIMRALPGVTVVAPGDEWEAGAATTAIAARSGTFYLRLDKSMAPPTVRANETFRLGKARRIREGGDLTLVTCGGILGAVLAAAEDLSSRGIDCRVLSMHTVKPMDRDALIAAARETGGIVTIEEHSILGGLGGAVAEVLLDAGANPSRFLRIGLADRYSDIVGSQEYLRTRYGMDTDTIVARVLELVGARVRAG